MVTIKNCTNCDWKLIAKIAAAVLAVAAVVALILIFRDDIKRFLTNVKEKIESTKEICCPELDDFEDI